MIDESVWINPYHGLELYPGFKQNSRDNENGILFLVEYYILKNELSILTKADIDTFRLIVANIRTYRDSNTQYSGLFDRGAKESLTIPKSKLRTISHDNISAIACFSAYIDSEHKTDIYKHLKKNLGRFDNVYPEAPRWARMMRPRDLILWSYLGSKGLSRAIYGLLMPYFYLTQIISLMARKETSGPLLTMVRMAPLVKKSYIAKIIWKLATKYMVKKRGGWDVIFSIYFKSTEHPNRVLSAKLVKSKEYLFF